MNWRAMGILAVSSCFPLSVVADGFYMSEKLSAINFDDDLGTLDAASNLDINFGYDFNDIFGVEAGFSASVSSGAAGSLDQDYDVITAYGVFRTPTNPYLRVKAGYAKTEIEIQGFTPADSTSESYGLGVGYRFSGGVRLELEGTILNVDDNSADSFGGVDNFDNDVQAIQFGVTVPFSSQEVGGLAGESKFYYGISFNGADLEGGTAPSLDMNGLTFRFGREFGKWMAAEFHLGTSADASKNVLRDPEVNFTGVFARFNLPFESVNLYALLGRSEVDISVAGGTNATEKDFAQGFGIDLIADDTISLHIESVSYGDDSTAPELKVLSIGFTKRFDFPSLR